MKNQLMFIHCLSPLHAGVGQGTAAVDLAIARERTTGLPYLPGSSIKGSLRALETDPQKRNDIFGYSRSDDVASNQEIKENEIKEHAGILAFGDAHLLFLPVRSIAGTFAYVTSPYILNRIQRDLSLVENRAEPIKGAWNSLQIEEGFVPTSSRLTVDEQYLYFEDLNLTTQTSKKDAQWVDGLSKALANRLFPNDATQSDLFQQRFCIVHDDVMRFLTQHATDVVTRVALQEETKTAKDNMLWTEENLPTESILASLVSSLPNIKSRSTDEAAFERLRENTKHGVQFGGNATIGRGRCYVTFSGGRK